MFCENSAEIKKHEAKNDSIRTTDLSARIGVFAVSYFRSAAQTVRMEEKT